MKNIILLIIVCLFISSCGKNDSTYPESVDGFSRSDSESLISSLIINDSSDNLPWDSMWTSALSDVLSKDELRPLFETRVGDQDLRLVGCSKFNTLSKVEKKVFFIVFLASIAEAESDFDIYNHTPNYSDNTMNVGLLQIDHASAIRHDGKSLGYTNRSQLQDPILNLSIGANILANQIKGGINGNRPDVKGRLFTSKSYYWSVLTKNQRVLKNMDKNKHNLVFCE